MVAPGANHDGQPPTPMQSAREAPTGTKRRSCEREGVESAPTREELRKKIRTSSNACRSEAKSEEPGRRLVMAPGRMEGRTPTAVHGGHRTPS